MTFVECSCTNFGQRFHILDWSFGQDAVTQIENVSGTPGGAAQNIFGARLQFLPIREEQDRIEISLHGAFEVEISPAFVKRDAPVEPNHFGAGFSHRGQKGSAVCPEINYWHTCFLQSLHQFGGARQHIAAIVLDAEAADPAVEDLNDISARAHLLSRIFGDDRHQLAHQLDPTQQVRNTSSSWRARNCASRHPRSCNWQG